MQGITGPAAPATVSGERASIKATVPKGCGKVGRHVMTRKSGDLPLIAGCAGEKT